MKPDILDDIEDVILRHPSKRDTLAITTGYNAHAQVRKALTPERWNAAVIEEGVITQLFGLPYKVDTNAPRDAVYVMPKATRT